MKKSIAIVVGAVSLSIMASSDVINKGEIPKDKDARIKFFNQKIYEKTGGHIKKPGTMAGKIVFVNAQKKIDFSVVKKDADFIAKALRIDIVALQGEQVNINTAEVALKNLKAQLGVFIIDDPQSTQALVLVPESRFAIVNIAPLASDGSSGRQLEGRLRKEIGRGFGIVSGAFNSKFEWTILGPVTKPKDLDRINEFYLTADIQPRIMPYLAALGVLPYELRTYKRACQEGWAPVPTNDVQKAIWDKVHAMPTAPIKIKPETKKVRE